MVDILSKRTAKGAGQISLWVFAFIGFIAASIEIVEYWAPDPQRLKVEVYPNKYRNPQAVKKAFGTLEALETGTPLRTVVSKLYHVRCEPKNLKAVEANNSNIESFNDVSCDQARYLRDAVTFVGSDDFLPLTFFEVKIKNEGSVPARDIRISSDMIERVEQTIGVRDTRSVEKKEGAYLLSTLNPGEETTIFCWGSSYGEPFSSGPRITYAGDRIHTTVMAPASPEPVDLLPFIFERLSVWGRILLVWMIVGTGFILHIAHHVWRKQYSKKGDSSDGGI